MFVLSHICTYLIVNLNYIKQLEWSKVLNLAHWWYDSWYRRVWRSSIYLSIPRILFVFSYRFLFLSVDSLPSLMKDFLLYETLRAYPKGWFYWIFFFHHKHIMSNGNDVTCYCYYRLENSLFLIITYIFGPK